MSRALLLFAAGLMMMGATCVVLLPGALAPAAGAVLVLAGAGGVSSSSDVPETLSRTSMVSSLTGAGCAGAGCAGAGWTGAGWALRVPCLGCVLKMFQLLICNLSY